MRSKAVAPLAALLLVAACSSSAKSTATATSSSPTAATAASVPVPAVPLLVAHPSGYVIPAHLAAGPAGTLLAASAAHPEPALGAAEAWQILYRSVWPPATGVVSGLVLLPHGSPPKGGWPIVAWAHGTSGLADQCAPSLSSGLADDSTAVGEVRRLLGQGWAVVATDYPGLGTPGVHPYLIGKINGPAVVDSVLAARHLVPDLSRTWVLVGHSEGGQAALFAAQSAVSRAPGLDYRGVVALAPASLLEGLLPVAQAGHDPTLSAYAIYTLAGVQQVDPSVVPSEWVSAAAEPALADLTQTCDDQLMADLGKLDPPHLLRMSDAAINKLALEVGQLGDPDRAHAPGPILLLQGTDDTDVPKGTTIVMAHVMCTLHDEVSLKLYPGQDHAGVVTASWPYVKQWITDRFEGKPASTTCH